MVSLNRPAKVLLYLVIVSATFYGTVNGQDVADTLELVPLPPDSFYVKRVGAGIVIGWYPRDDSISAAIGSKDFSNWFTEHGPTEGVRVDIVGKYIGSIDRTVIFEKSNTKTATVGGSSPDDSSIVVFAQTIDKRGNTYRQSIDIGSGFYNPGDLIDIMLVNQEPPNDTLNLGIRVAFHEGIVDTSLIGGLAFFLIDFQDFEGFHIWRGLSPYPSDMDVLVELSKENAFIGIAEDSVYFEEYPKFDSREREYYEWFDDNVFVGFTYYYHVTCYDRGYFKGFFKHNKWDSYICEDEDYTQFYEPPEEPLACEDAGKEITMRVSSGDDIGKVYAVPNPYRTGTSAETSPYYHNFPDGTVKFFNVPREAELKIFTVAGDLVWETYQTSPDGSDGVISWNTENKEGNEVYSGIYIFRCKNDENGEFVYGRLIIIR